MIHVLHGNLKIATCTCSYLKCLFEDTLVICAVYFVEHK
jgi:hypothetical protein